MFTSKVGLLVQWYAAHWPTEKLNLTETSSRHIIYIICFSTSIFLGGTHLFLASPPPGGPKNTFVPLLGMDKNMFVSSEGEGGGMHLYPSQVRKNYCFHPVRQGVKIYVTNRSKL